MWFCNLELSDNHSHSQQPDIKSMRLTQMHGNWCNGLGHKKTSTKLHANCQQSEAANKVVIFLALPLCRDASGNFVVEILEHLAGDFPGGSFWALFFPQIWGEESEAKSAKYLFCQTKSGPTNRQNNSQIDVRWGSTNRRSASCISWFEHLFEMPLESQCQISSTTSHNMELFWDGSNSLKLQVIFNVWFESQGAAKGGRQKEFDNFFFCIWSLFGHCLVTFTGALITFSALFCQTPFAGLLLLESFCGKVRITNRNCNQIAHAILEHFARDPPVLKILRRVNFGTGSKFGTDVAKTLRRELRSACFSRTRRQEKRCTDTGKTTAMALRIRAPYCS